MVREAVLMRAEEAQRRSALARRDASRVRRLVREVRNARDRDVDISRCAWCKRYRLGDEWLSLEEIGSGSQRLPAFVLRRASGEICADCFAALAATTSRSGDTLSPPGP